jgi:molybdopterin molybdotransferase
MAAPPAAPERITVEEATRLILEHMPRWPAVRVPLAEAGGGVLREVITAERDQPPFDRVTMDGVAVASAALAAGRRGFRIAGTQGAGAEALRLANDDECIEVMTGGVLPHGADAVVPVERIRRGDGTATVESGYAANPGQFVHRRGSDHRRGDVLLQPGTAIRPPEMAILTIGGRADVAITRAPRIAVISTGDELVEAGQPIADFQIRSSNDLAIEAALRRRSFSDVTRTLLRDDPALLRREIGRLLETSDVLILSGGVSMGQFDYMPKTLAGLGVDVVFHKVTQRPGLPMWFGTTAAGKVVFALPGNPVSSLVCLVRYVAQGLTVAMGSGPRPAPPVRLAAAVEFRPDLTWFLPVKLEWDDDGEVAAAPRPTNTSGDFVALAGTDGFVELPRGRDHFPARFAARFFGW